MAQLNLSPPECLVWAVPTDLYGYDSLNQLN